MPVEPSDLACPDCGERLQVFYATERKQVISGYACGECGFAASEKEGLSSVTLSEPKEYVLRIEKQLSSEDVRDPLESVEDEFRTRARAAIEDDEVWLLLDPERDEVVDFVTQDSFSVGDGSRGEGNDERHDEENEGKQKTEESPGENNGGR